MDRHHPNVAAQQARADLIAKKTAAAAGTKRKLQIVMLVIVVACGAGLALTMSDVFFMIGFLPFFLLLISFFVGVPQQHLTMEEYKGLPGALDQRGQHRCIACGHHGIYRRTIYQTTTTLAACSKCQAPLWASEAE